MSLAALGGSACIATSLAALAFAALRLASLVSPRGGERILATVTAIAAAAVVQALALGLLGLGTSQLALTASSIAIGGFGFALLPSPATALGDELGSRWAAASGPARILAGAAVGVALAWAGFALLRPTLDLDSTLFDLPQIAVWMSSGHPGSIELISSVFPIGSYPLTNEVVMTWLAAVSGNVGWVLLWPLAAGALLLLAARTALRVLGLGVTIATVAPIVVLLVPIVAESLTSLDSDLASTAWVATSVALCASVATASSRPELLAFAIVAAALAIGTKTTVAPLALLALGVALLTSSRRPRLGPIGVALAVAVAVGGVWYLRNLIDHGSPLWPFVAFPGGDPLPISLDFLAASFIGSPLDTLDNRIGAYLDKLGPGPLLIASAVLLPLFTRRRRLALASAAVALSFLLWSVAPATGEPEGSAAELFQVSGARYLMAPILLATGVVAAVAAGRGSVAIVARAVLVVAAGWGLVDLVLGRDGVPPFWLVAAAAVLGALATAAVMRPLGLHSHPATARVAVGGCILAAGLAMAAYPGRFLDRFADHGTVEDPLEDSSASFGGLAEMFEQLPAYREGTDPILFADVLIGPLTGGSFAHDLGLISPDTPCTEVATFAGGSWIVVSRPISGEAPPIVDCISAADQEASAETPGGGSIQIYRLQGGTPG